MKEIPLHGLLRSVTTRRLLNAAAAGASFVLSALLKRRIVWGRPFILTVEPTNLCNLRCPLCVTGNGKLTRNAGQMDFDLFRRIIDDVGEFLFYLLLYHQGEPFLNKRFLD
ncbi:MAG: radical SAM protein, partial [Calditrichaeota bacterium]